MKAGLPRSISITGVTLTTPRAEIEWAAHVGARAVQIDATRAGLRPRELGRSARRDVASTLRRCGLAFSGLDLLIPPLHFVDPAHADRAAAALRAALELAAELADLCETPASISPGANRVVCVSLEGDAGRTAVEALADAAEALDARIADHQWPAKVGTRREIAVGLDAAVIAAAGCDPVAEAARLARFAGAARIADWTPRLDDAAFAAALGAGGFAGFLVVDLRRSADAERSARELLGG